MLERQAKDRTMCTVYCKDTILTTSEILKPTMGYLINTEYILYSLRKRLTSRDLVGGGFPWLPEIPKSGIGLDVDCHTSQEDHMTKKKARIVEP